MNATAISGIVLSSLNAVQAVLPLLGPAGASVSAVTSIIGLLTKVAPVIQHLAPLAGDEATLIYQGTKNIIANLRSDSIATTAEQDAALDALDKRVDDAWDAIAPQFDPDYVPPAGGPAVA